MFLNKPRLLDGYIFKWRVASFLVSAFFSRDDRPASGWLAPLVMRSAKAPCGSVAGLQ